ncbi:iron complex outermembrane receptor protein [Chromatocurvus halotolerans]|uniref:Iron complex outermembrane receptor protein n=2 Tax=Chromatocurvus halotolerans TaxID=1132028 RepID=A0A4R2L0P4_9GAMM|nr:iron complex outermembrane receptor protein [Chromatocurvus halotolerans]
MQHYSRNGGLADAASRLPRFRNASVASSLMALTILSASPVVASPAPSMLQEIVVTARKRREAPIDAPIAITAFSGAQIESLRIRDLTQFTAGLPNVALDDVGTRRGTANFSIRGLGINSSIPSIDPTVGLFVNGVYLAVNNDMIFDVFDLASVEVLRGPQGVLFGRNVTGGALLLQTRRPGDALEVDIRSALEGGGDGGLNRYLMAGVSGPITDTLSGRFSAYYNDDEGYFSNDFDGEDFGAITQRMLRGTLAWTPDADTSVTLFYQNTDIEGDGPATQSHTNGSGLPGTPVNNPRDSLHFSIDERGYQDVSTDLVTLQTDRNVALGDGTVTHIFGWQQSESVGMSDIDGQPVFLFHSPGWVDAMQWSNELRYSGRFADRADVTAGLYQFKGELSYHDRRLFLGELSDDGGALATQDGGGHQNTETFGVFAATDYALNTHWAVNAGLRWSSEEKSVQVASFNLNSTPCNIVLDNDCPLDFIDQAQFDTLAPRLGLSWRPHPNTHVYTSWTRSFRSGGYNLRNSNSAEPPGPFGEEQVDSVELGYKRVGERWRLNAAMFYTRVDDMQREVNLPSESAGILQLIRNTAVADIAGLELDGQLQVTDGLQLQASLGYLDAGYDKVSFDLNGDGQVDALDRALELPRAPEWTGSLSGDYRSALRNGAEIGVRLSYSYRDRVAYTDNNAGFILAQDVVDAGIDYISADGHWQIAAYGRNLLNSVKHGGDSQLPEVFIGQPLGGTFSPLAKGRVIGVELTWRLAP